MEFYGLFRVGCVFINLERCVYCREGEGRVFFWCLVMVEGKGISLYLFSIFYFNIFYKGFKVVLSIYIYNVRYIIFIRER